MGEQLPLEDKYPERQKAMIAAYNKWAKGNGVLSILTDWNS